MKKALLPFLIFVFLCGGFSSAQVSIYSTYAGNGISGFFGDGGPATACQFNQPGGVAVDNTGALLVVDELNNRIRKVYGGGVISTIAGVGPSGAPGSFGGDGGPAASANLNAPLAVAVDAAGNIYIADNENQRVRKINTSGIISTIGGTGVSGYAGDGTPATSALISNPQGITVDASGNVFFSQPVHHIVRKISTTGIITTVAGTGTSGSSGDGGPATDAKLTTPRGLRTDGAGNLYIADYGGNRVRKVDASGMISTAIGGGSGGGVGVPATSVSFSSPGDVAIDGAGNLYVSSEGSDVVRKVSPSGIIGAFYNDVLMPAAEGCAATVGMLHQPRYLAVDGAGRVYVDAVADQRIRMVSTSHKPAFAGGHNISISMCSDTLISLDTVLAILDPDVETTETWSILTGASHGSSIVACSLASTGTTTYATGTFYIPGPGYTGGDDFVVLVTDCVGGKDTTNVHVTVNNCSLGSPNAAKEPPPGLTIYPNPSDGHFSLVVNGPEAEVRIRITDEVGHTVRAFTAAANKLVSVNLGVSPGMYILQAATSGNCYTRSLIVK